MDRGRLIVRFNVLLSFRCADGYLSAGGIEGDRLHLRAPPVTETGDTALPFFSFSSNVFRVAQTRSQVAAAADVRSGKGSARGGGSSKKAASPSRDDMDDSSGSGSGGDALSPELAAFSSTPQHDPITYGQAFSLQHVDSGLFVSVAHTQPSSNDPDCVSVILVNDEAARSGSCEFIFVSRYKVHSDGDSLCRADEVLIRLAAKPVFLHVSAPAFMDRTAAMAAVEAEMGSAMMPSSGGGMGGDLTAAEGLDALNRTFRLGANLSFSPQGPAATSGGGGGGAYFAAQPALAADGALATGIFSAPPTTTTTRGGGGGGIVEEIIEGLSRAYLDEVNGCEEGGVSFILDRYDVGTDHANAQRGQLPITRPYVACGVPLCLYHREREAFLTTSVTNPRAVPHNVLADTEGGGVPTASLKPRRFRGDMSGVQALSGAEGRIHVAMATEDGFDGSTTRARAESYVNLDQLDTVSNQSRALRSAMAAAPATTTTGFVEVSATRRLPFPAFAAHAEEIHADSEATLSDTRSGATSLWVFECDDPTQGGPVRVQHGAYRIKHVITGMYLAVFGNAVDDFFADDIDAEEAAAAAAAAAAQHHQQQQQQRRAGGFERAADDDDDDSHSTSTSDMSSGSVGPLSSRSYKAAGGVGGSILGAVRPVRETQLCMIPEPRSRKDIARTLFSVENMFASECGWLIEQDCLFVKNLLTSMYVATDSAFDGPNIRLRLQWQPSVADTIVVSYTGREAQRDAVFVFHHCQTLAKFRDAFQAAATDKEEYRQQRVAAAEAGDPAASAEVARWAADKATWAAVSNSRRGTEDIDLALLRSHRLQRTSQGQQAADGLAAVAAGATGAGGISLGATSNNLSNNSDGGAPTHPFSSSTRTAAPMSSDYLALSSLIRQSQDALVSLIHFCQRTEDGNLLRGEGLPIHSHQRTLYDMRVFRLVFDVILTPFARLAEDPTFTSTASAAAAAPAAEAAPRGGGNGRSGSGGGGHAPALARSASAIIPSVTSYGGEWQYSSVYNAVLAASQQRQVLMHTLWDTEDITTHNAKMSKINGADNDATTTTGLHRRLPLVPLRGGVIEADEIMLPRHAEVHLVLRLAFRLLKLMIADRSAFSAGWDAYIKHCLELDGRRLHVVETLAAMFTDNLNLPLQAVKTVARHFIGSAKEIRRASYLEFLGAACTFGFRGIPARQEYITRKLLVEHPELLSEVILRSDGVVCIVMDSAPLSGAEGSGDDSKGKDSPSPPGATIAQGDAAFSPAAPTAAASSRELVPVADFFLKSTDKKLATFVENQISLFTHLCYDGATQFCRDEVAKRLTPELVVQMVRTGVWTGVERVGTSSRLDELRAHWIRLAFQCFIVEKIRDPVRQLRVSTVLFGSSALRENKEDALFYSGHADDEMTAALKAATLSILQANPYFVQDDIRRSSLMRGIVAVWFRLIRYRQYTDAELDTVLPLLLGLLDGTQDVLSSNPVVVAQQVQARRDALDAEGRARRKATAPRGGGDGGGLGAAMGSKGLSKVCAEIPNKISAERLKTKRESVHLMRLREMVCQALGSALENAMFKGADEVIVFLHAVYTNPESVTVGGKLQKPWKKVAARQQSSSPTAAFARTASALLGYGSTGDSHAVHVSSGESSGVGEATPLLSGAVPRTTEAGCCCGLCTRCRRGSKAMRVRADGYEEIGSGGEEDGTLASGGDGDDKDSNSSDSDNDEGVFAAAKRLARDDSTVVTAPDIRDYLDHQNDAICRRFCPEKLLPLLLDVTRYNWDALTVQSMRLLVRLCIVRRHMAQMILTVNSLPSFEVVKGFDRIYDVAAELRKTTASARVFGEAWEQCIKVAVGTLLDNYEPASGVAAASGSPVWKPLPTYAAGAAGGGSSGDSEAETPPPAQIEDDGTAAAAPTTRETVFKDIYSSFALSTRERHTFGTDGDDDGHEKHHHKKEGDDTTTATTETADADAVAADPHLSAADAHKAAVRARAKQLWAKTAGATRMLIYSNTIRSRRRALGLSETSTTPMNLVVRAEMMAHWRIHETLLAMLPSVPPSGSSFFRLMKFFYFFTMSESNAKLLRESLGLFIDVLPRCDKARALCLNVIVAILGTMHDVDGYLSAELLASFVQRIDGEVNTTIPDKEFVQLLSDKIFSRPAVSVVVRRRTMLILREHSTLYCLSRPRMNPTVVEVDFTAALVNLVCNICGTDISVLTLAQRMLRSDSICRIVVQRFVDNPLCSNVDLGAGGGGGGRSGSLTLADSFQVSSPSLGPGSPASLDRRRSSGGGGGGGPASDTTGTGTPTPAGGSGFQLINPYLRALVALYFTTPEDNLEDRRGRQRDWMSNPVWWDMVRLLTATFTRSAALMAENKGRVENAGIEMIENNRLYFLTTAPTTLAAFFINLYSREWYTKCQAKIIKTAFADLLMACAAFGKQMMAHVNAMQVSVEEVVSFRRLLGVIGSLGHRSGYAAMSAACDDCDAVKDAMRAWLADQQTQLHGQLLVEQVARQQLGIAHVSEEDVGAFDILFREEAVSTQLQRGIIAGSGLHMPSAASVRGVGVTEVRAALRAILRGNTLIPSLRRHPSHVARIANALLIQSTYRASIRASLRSVLRAMRSHLFTPRTSVGLLNLFNNSLDSLLYRFPLNTTIDKVLGTLPRQQLVDKDEGPRMAPEWELAQAASGNTNASIPEDSLAYGLQVVYNALGMTSVAVTLCAIDDEVVTYSAARLAIGILEGGNARVQVTLLNYFTTREESFFHSVRSILRSSLGWVERVNGEHQYCYLKRGMRRPDLHMGAAAANAQLVEALKPREQREVGYWAAFVRHGGKEGGGEGDGCKPTTTAAAAPTASSYVVPAITKDSAINKLSGWGRVRGSRRIKLIESVFRLLQLFCEGHQPGMQNYIRAQHDNLHSANMVHESATLLAELSLYITPANIKVVRQGFDLMTEVCQGPCRANQESLVNYDGCWTIGHCLAFVNGPDIVIGDPGEDGISTLSDAAVGDLRTAMSTTALALIEGCRDEEMYLKVLAQLPLQDIEVEIASVRPSLLFKICNDEAYEHHPRAEALYNWLMYLRSVEPYADDLQVKQIHEILRRSSALSHYLGSIEISRDDGLERVYFRIPNISESLTRERKQALNWGVDRTSRATKLADFLHKSDELIFAIEQQHDFVVRVRRWTRFAVDYDPEASAFRRWTAHVRISFNTYAAPLVFSYEVNYYEAVSMVLAILVNVILLIFEGVKFQGRVGKIVRHHEIATVWVLCLMQTFVCLALCYVDVVVALPVHLYQMYKEKQRFDAGKATFDINIDEVYAGLTRRECVECFLGWFGAQFRFFLLVMAALSWLVSPYFAAFNLMLLIYKIPTLRTFITAITANGKQLLLTGLLGVIMVYLFSIVGYLLFAGQYEPDAEGEDTSNCETLSQCFLYILNRGLRAGGGVADVMKPWTWSDSDVVARMTYDMLFFALVTVVFLNILFGIIIDTFGAMRDEKNEKEEDMHGLCFICALGNDTLERTGVSGFQNHVNNEHNMWMYLYFMHHLRRKDPTEFTGQESYVNAKIQQNSLSFFPCENSLSLMAIGGGGGGSDSGDSSSSDDDDDGHGHDHANGSGAGGGGGDDVTGKSKGGKGGAAAAVSAMLKDLGTAKNSLNAYLKEIGADSSRLKAVLQQLEVSARGSAVSGLGGGNGNGCGNGGGGGGGSSSQALAAARSRSINAAGGGGGGDATAKVRGLEQQLRQEREERARLKEEGGRQRAAAERKDAEIQRLRAQLAKAADRESGGKE